MNNFWSFDLLKNRIWLTRWLFGVVVLLALSLRTFGLKTSPPGLYVDEASIGYNAYSILETGKDEYGVSWPFFFRAFGEYKNPVFIYSLAPLIKVFGLIPETIRLGAAIWGVLAVILIIQVAIIVSKNWTFSLLSGLILSLMPWHLHYSRLGFEAICFPTLLLLSLWLFLKWIEKKKVFLGLLFSLSLYVVFYSYTTARLWLPLFLGFLVILFRKKWPKNYQTPLVLISVGLLMLPLASWLQQYPESLMARMNQISIWSDKPTLGIMVNRFLKTYLGHLSPDFLFLRGDVSLRHSSGVSSELLISWSFSLLIGLGIIIKKLFKQPFWQLVLIMIGLFPLAASLTQTSPIATRTIQVTPFFALVIALGIWWCLKKLSKKKVLLILFVMGFSMMMGLEFGNYYKDLIYEYPKRVWMPWHGFDGDLPQAITLAYEKSLKESKQLFLSDEIEQAYIQGLFFTKADPKLWQEKQQAPFNVEKFKTIQPNQVWVLTRDECRKKDRNYCVAIY